LELFESKAIFVGEDSFKGKESFVALWRFRRISLGTSGYVERI